MKTLYILSIYATDDIPGMNYAAERLDILERSLDISYGAIPNERPTIKNDKLIAPSGKILGQLFRTQYEFLSSPQHL